MARQRWDAPRGAHAGNSVTVPPKFHQRAAVAQCVPDSGCGSMQSLQAGEAMGNGGNTLRHPVRVLCGLPQLLKLVGIQTRNGGWGGLA